MPFPNIPSHLAPNPAAVMYLMAYTPFHKKLQ